MGRSKRPFWLGSLVLGLLAGPTSRALAQRVLWADAPQLSAAARRATRPLAHFRPVTVQLPALRAALQPAPAEGGPAARQSATVVSLPLPDGTSQRFRVVQVPVMAPALAARFPEIRTYAAQGLDDPTATARFDVSPAGLHALILAADKTVYIDPAEQGSDTHLVFERRAMNRGAFPFVCATPAAAEAASAGPMPTARPAVANGTTLRTYRLALACTGEYAAYYGGTNAGAMAGMVASINRVNAIYEKELAVRLVMVAGNDNLIFLNPDTDPYTNDNGTAMLEQNQKTVDARIGAANYDIGHVFSTGGGGIAQRPSVCIDGDKAQGVTGSSAPINDAFNVDYVAHEMGHQFGADHTFNSNSGFCSGNRSPSSAYEPGSGTTIMAYAGICGADDIQPNSDPYFHSRSFDQIVAHITGAGNCSVNTPTGNTPPVVNAGRNYAIPVSTPFVLTGSATDANNDALTYSWEEFDLGPSGSPLSPTSNAPLFRAFTPTASPTRTFPRLSDLLNNTQTIGERLPTYGRRLVFRLVARDNRAGGGGVDYDSMAVVVVPTAGPFVVTAPNTATTWLAGAQQQVTWNVANTAAAPLNVAAVDILLSLDGGQTYPTVLAANTPNDGCELITVPAALGNSGAARVRVQARGGIFFDISNQNFTLTTPTAPTFYLLGPGCTTPSLVFCAGGSAALSVGTGQLQGFSGEVALAATNLPAGLTVSFAAPTVAAGGATTATLTADATTAAGTYTIRLTGTSGGTTRVLDVPLTVLPTVTQPVVVTAPTGTGVATLRPRISWQSLTGATAYEVQLATDAGFANLVLTQTGLTATSFTPAAALQPNTTYYLRVRGAGACGAGPYSATGQFRTGTHTCQTFTATQVPRTIGTGAGATANSTIIIGNTERVSDLRVRNLDVTHPNVGELEITLTSPAGRQAVLFARGCSGTANLSLSLADDAAAALTCPPPSGGPVRPATSLGELLNESAFGFWTLTVTDAVAGNGGSLTGWALEVCTLNEAPAAPSGLETLAPVVANNSAAINLLWLDNAGNETSFEIERARTGFEGFTRIATVAPNVTAYTDQVQLNGTYCYRVRAVNATGPSGYSNESCQTVSTITSAQGAGPIAGVAVYPNPSADVFNVQIDSAQRGSVTLRLIDALGRTILTQTLPKTAGALRHQLDLRNLPTGVYTLHLALPDASAVLRLLKQ